jgi:stage IV sporulation protein FB
MKLFESLLFALISILIHEIAHIAIALVLGIKPGRIRIVPVGLNAVIKEESAPFWKKLIVYSSGPAANGVLYMACILVLRCVDDMHAPGIEKPWYVIVIRDYESSILNFANTNFYLLILNILPVVPLDGSSILIDALVRIKGIYTAHKYTKKLSLIFAALFIFAGFIQLAYSFLFLPFINHSLIAIGIYIIVFMMLEKEEAAFMNIKQIFFRRSRLLKKGIYPVRDLVVAKTMPIGAVLKNLDFDRFHIIYVLDDDFKVLKMYTEQEIINAIASFSPKMTFEEFIKI